MIAKGEGCSLDLPRTLGASDTGASDTWIIHSEPH